LVRPFEMPPGSTDLTVTGPSWVERVSRYSVQVEVSLIRAAVPTAEGTVTHSLMKLLCFKICV